MGQAGGFAAAAPRQLLGLRILHDFGRIFCAKGKLLPIESKLSCFPIFAGVCTFRGRKRQATADRCACPAAIMVNSIVQQAGSFIPPHL
jgi:hypothetical protein